MRTRKSHLNSMYLVLKLFIENYTSIFIRIYIYSFENENYGNIVTPWFAGVPCEIRILYFHNLYLYTYIIPSIFLTLFLFYFVMLTTYVLCIDDIFLFLFQNDKIMI